MQSNLPPPDSCCLYCTHPHDSHFSPPTKHYFSSSPALAEPPLNHSPKTTHHSQPRSSLINGSLPQTFYCARQPPKPRIKSEPPFPFSFFGNSWRPCLTGSLTARHIFPLSFLDHCLAFRFPLPFFPFSLSFSFPVQGARCQVLSFIISFSFPVRGAGCKVFLLSFSLSFSFPFPFLLLFLLLFSFPFPFLSPPFLSFCLSFSFCFFSFHFLILSLFLANQVPVIPNSRMLWVTISLCRG